MLDKKVQCKKAANRIEEKKKAAISKALDAKVKAKIGKRPEHKLKQRFKPRFYTNTNTRKMASKPKAPKNVIGSRPKINVNDVLRNIISTEAATKNLETANTLVLEVHPQASKTAIKNAFQVMHNIKLVKVSTLNTMKGKKKAFCRLPNEVEAFEIATKVFFFYCSYFIIF